MAMRTCCVDSGLQRRRIDITNICQFSMFSVMCNSIEMIFRYSATANQSNTNFAVGDGSERFHVKKIGGINELRRRP